MSKRYRGISDAQANALAVARREMPYTAASRSSVTVAWDYRSRMPKDLGDALRSVRRAYADEVPTKLHDSAIGEGGTPRMTAKAEGYLFGSHTASDAKKDPETGQYDAISYYHAPFRACLASLECGTALQRIDAAIVRHVTIGQMTAEQAAEAEGIGPQPIRERVVKAALFAFLTRLSDIRIQSRQHTPLQESTTAA